MIVIKRDGVTKENYNLGKIIVAVNKAYVEIGEIPKGYKLAEYLEDRNFEDEEITIDDIQEIVQIALMEMGEYKALNAYMKHRITRDIDRQEEIENPWGDFDERQDMFLEKYLLDGETKAEMITRVSNGNEQIAKIMRKKEAIFGGRNLSAIGREGNITGSNCFVRGTKVSTINGEVEIQDIKINELVLTHDGSYQKVNATMQNHHDGEMYIINSIHFNEPIITTPNHKFLTQEGWVEAKDLSVHKRGPKIPPHYIKYKPLNLEDGAPFVVNTSDVLSNIIGDEFILVEDGDMLQPKVKHLNKGTLSFTKSTIKPINKTFVIDAELAYVFGRFAGDGN
jgi:hypothetical protein